MADYLEYDDFSGEGGERPLGSGMADVVSTLDDMHGPKLRNLTDGESAYADWIRDKSPESMARVINAYMPTINSEITRYSGPRELLRSRAKVLAIHAVKTFNPMAGARLNSWIVTSLKPLSRYSSKQRDIKVPEVLGRQAAEIAAVTERLTDELGREPTLTELADETGISVKRIEAARKRTMASITSGTFDDAGQEDSSLTPGVVQPDKVEFARDAVYQGLSQQDKFIFDAATGSHGVKPLPALEVARMLGVSPATISQKAKSISEQITYVVNHG